MSYSRSTETALLQWINTFPLDSKVDSLNALSDGRVLNLMLGDIDNAYAVEDLEKNAAPSKWLGKKKSLEAVYKSLLRYIRNHCNDLDTISLENTIDLNSIAEHDDTQQTVKLLTILLMAAVKGTNNQKYVRNITEGLDAPTQAEIASIIQQMEKQAEHSATTANWKDARLPLEISKDLDLALEQEHATLYADHAALKKRHADFMTRFEHLQDNHDELLERSRETERQLEALKNSNDGDMADYVQSLKKELQETNDLIATQEQQIEQDRVTRERHQRELNSLRPASDRLIALEDEVKELKTENATLSRKANTLDHFQRKLESQAGVEKENARLRGRIDTLEDNQKDFDRVYEDNVKLQTTIGEYQKRFNSYELQVVELANQKKILEEDLRHRDAQILSLNENKHHDEKFIQDLQEQIRSGLQPSLSPQASNAEPTSFLTLEQELEQSDDSVMNYALEISRLKAENQLLKSNTAGIANANLRIDLEESERARKQVEDRLQQVTEQHAIAQEQLQAIINSSSGEKNEAVINTRKLYLEANQELSITKTRLAELTTELSSRDRELLAARTDLSAINQEDVDALEELKAAHELINSSLQSDLLLAQTRLKARTTDFELQKSHLVEALLSKDKLRQEIATIQEGKPPVAAGGDSLETSEVQGSVDGSKIAFQALKEQHEKQGLVVLDLQRRLKIADESSAEAQKAASEALIKNLYRENAMMATAWYDLTSRLQSNHVVLQRRQDAPKSWLNKQRQMVNATPRR